MYHFEVEHAKFYKTNFGGFWVINFSISSNQPWNDSMINYLIGEYKGRLMHCLGDLAWASKIIRPSSIDEFHISS